MNNESNFSDANEPHAISGSEPPIVSVADSGPGSITNHRDDIFFAAVETTRMPMVVTDPHQMDNPIVFANRAFLSMTGYSQDEVVGRNCRFLQGPKSDQAVVQAVREAIADSRELSVELINYRKDGTSFWNALFISPVRDEQNQVVYFFASQLDVSRRRDAELALSQAQRMESLGQLTGGIAHDFNNLLQVIAGHLDLLTLHAGRSGMSSEGALRNVASAKNAVGKAATLTSQLLAFARKQRLEGRTVNLNGAAKNLVAMVTGTLGPTVISLEELEPDLWNCNLDPNQLEGALLNVMVNARDAMPGGGAIRVATGNVAISPEDRDSFGGLAPGRYASISISDCGHGIPVEILPHVLEPFFTTKEEGKGTGLGLSTVYGFAKQSGGVALIYSEVDVGTTVRLYFPAVFGTNDLLSSSYSLPKARGGHERVLVVDDRQEVADVAQAMLEGLGYRVQSAQSGHHAISLLNALPRDGLPNLLFSDVIMPGGMNGVSLAREVRRLVPSVRVLLTTGFSGNAEGDGSAGGEPEFAILKKPYRLEDLARKVRLVLDEIR